MRTASRKRAASALLIMKLIGVTLGVGVTAPRAAAAEDGDRTKAGAVPVAEASGALKAANFDEALEGALARRGAASRGPCGEKDAVSRRVLTEYGAVFLAGGQVLPPPVCIFEGAAEVAAFQVEARPVAATIDGVTIELQPAAMRALLAAQAEAFAEGLSITPRDGAEAARRDYADTVRLWNSRLLPALEHWTREGRLTAGEAERLRTLPVREQVGAVLELERDGIFFSKDFSKSILYSAAAPGASQHLSLLAFDVSEYADERVRGILARHGWFRTVRNDHPHFTYLGFPERLLPSHGLKKIADAGGEFWVPNVAESLEQRQLAGLQ
jgi:hypothetical protein